MSTEMLNFDLVESLVHLSSTIEVGNAVPMKQHAYSCPAGKSEIMKHEWNI